MQKGISLFNLENCGAPRLAASTDLSDSPMRPLVQLANGWCRFLCLLAMAGSRGHLTMAHLCVFRLSAAGRGGGHCQTAPASLLRQPPRPHAAVRTLRSPASARRTAPGQRRTARNSRSTSSRATCRFFIDTLDISRTGIVIFIFAEWRQNRKHAVDRGPKKGPEKSTLQNLWYFFLILIFLVGYLLIGRIF